MGIQIDPTVITKIEKGTRAVRLDEAVYAARALGVPLSVLVTDRDPGVQIDELKRRLDEQKNREAAALSEATQAQQSQAEGARKLGVQRRRKSLRQAWFTRDQIVAEVDNFDSVRGFARSALRPTASG